MGVEAAAVEQGRPTAGAGPHRRPLSRCRHRLDGYLPHPIGGGWADTEFGREGADEGQLVDGGVAPCPPPGRSPRYLS